jgi:hypothetical protein
LEVRLDAVGAVILDGLSYRRAGRAVGISMTEVGDSLDLLLGALVALGYCQPDGIFITTLTDLGDRLVEMAQTGEAVCVDGLATRVQRPRSWANQKVLYDAKRHAHTTQGLAVSTIHGDLLWCDGGWPGSCHEHELLALSGLGGVLDAAGVVGLLDRGFRGLAKARGHWHAPVGDRRTKDRLSDAQRAYNRYQAGLRALVEQAIGHLAGAWSLRRWRGLLSRVRDVYRGAHLPGPVAAPSTHLTQHREHPHCGNGHWPDVGGADGRAWWQGGVDHGASRGIDRAIVDRPTRTALWWCSASSASGRR